MDIRGRVEVKGLAHVFQALLARQKRLRARGEHSPNRPRFDWKAYRSGEASRQALGLVELPFPLFDWVERDRNDQVPFIQVKGGLSLGDKQPGQKWLKTQRTVVLVTVDCIQDLIFCSDGRAGEAEVQFSRSATMAYKRSRNISAEA